MCSTSLFNKILSTNLGACKPAFHTFYTSHLRWNSNMRRCFYHTDLRQNAAFHHFQEKLHSFNIQNHRSTRGLLGKPFKKFPKSPIRPAGSHFWQAPNFQWTLKELRFNIIKNLLCLFFLLNGFITMCNLKKRLIRAAFWVLLQAMFMNDWKQTAQRLKLQERLLTINKRNIIRWNIYRDNNFHSRRQVLKRL